MDIKDFLLARIAEDEAVANEAKVSTSTEWLAHGSLLMYVDASESRLAEVVGAVEDYRMDPAWKHAERHDPARVLAECAAKRAIVEQWDDPAFSDQGAYDSGHARAMDDAVRALAAVYADHPDYQPEWAQKGMK